MKQASDADWRIESRMILDEIEGLDREARIGSASVALIESGERAGIGEVSFSWGPKARTVTDLDPDWSRADWALDFEIPRIDRKYLGQRLGLRLVAGTMTHFSAGRTCLVSIVAEPQGWQSLKTDRREPQTRALIRHWSRIGFSDSFAYAPAGLRVHQVVRDYVVPTTSPVGPHAGRRARRGS